MMHRLLRLAGALILLLPCGFARASNSCEGLRGLKISAAEIGLPTTGGVVTSARRAESSGVVFCKVLGRLKPVDPSAQDIRFEVNLPDAWNGKAVHYGGAAFDGYLVTGLSAPVLGMPGARTPLQQGYTTFGGGSGHHKHYWLLPDILNALNSRFALNAEERINYAHDGLKKTHDAALVVMRTLYGRAPARTYFLGGSTGGREAYFVAQKWPADYDGVLGAYAGWNQVQLDLQFIAVSEALYTKGSDGQSGWLPRSKTRLLAAAVMRICDARDGVADGIISDPDGCHFDPATLLCADGHDHRGCLSNGQLRTVKAYANEHSTAQPLANGVQSIPGYNILRGADMTGTQGILSCPLHPPLALLNSFQYIVADGVLRFFVTRDTHFDALRFDATTGGKYAADLLPQSLASDASDSRLDAYKARGGKLLLIHGEADTTIPTGATRQYFGMLQKRYSEAELHSFIRFYEVPGYGHGTGVFNASFDALAVLDAWADGGVAPAGLVVTDGNRGAHRTRPLCEYPAWPRYGGTGDVNAAASFQCVNPEASR